MTDNKKPSQNAEKKSSPTADKKIPPKKVTETPSTPTAERKSSGKAGVILGVIAILLVLVLTVGLYYHGHQESLKQEARITGLQQQLQTSQQNLLSEISTDKQAIATQLNKTANQLAVMEKSEKLTTAQLESVQLSIANLKMRNPNEWMLSEAEYLIRMAGRKIALEHDVDTSLALLASANRRVTELNDPSLLPLRRVIEEDISLLAKIPRVDRDGIALKLSTQSKQLSDLPLAGFLRPKVELKDNELSSDVSDWKDNLAKTWHSFASDFITIRKREGSVEALLSPKEAWYLQENLKTKLLQAELAVYRENQEAYTNAVTGAIESLTKYYDTSKVETTAVIDALKSISDASIQTNYPTKLKSAAFIQTTIKERKINSLTSSTAQ